MSTADHSQTIEERAVVALRRISRAIDLHSRTLTQSHGLTSPQLTVLRTLAKTGPVSAGALARAVHLSQATVTGILTRLEKRSFVTRSRSSLDRRTVLVGITPEGDRVVQDVPMPLQDKLRDEFVKMEEWEQTTVLAALQRIAAMIDA